MSATANESVTASPKTTRSTSVSERRPLVPVTPQRNGRANRMRVASSPLTPYHSNSSVVSSPFTPITNIYSSSSSLTSPDSSVSTKVGFSPDSVKSKQRGIADATSNWRSRAKENGIKVNNDEFSYADALALNSPKESIPDSFLSTHRRSRQSLFQANSLDGTAFISPKTARMPIHDGAATVPIPSSLASSLLSTPESAKSVSESFTLATPSPRSSLAIVQRLRQRGSVTDPARPRRRHISGPISGETLFDIDEDAIMTYPYPDAFGSPITLREAEDTFIAKAKRCVSAPFIAARFYEGYVDEDDSVEFEDDGLPCAPRSSRMRSQSISSVPTVLSVTDVASEGAKENACSVCSASSSPLSVLIPCNHLICSSCLTSSLNIVGEKDMRCATCSKPVENFRLLSPLKMVPSISEDTRKPNDGIGATFNSDEQSARLLPSAIEDLSLHGLDGKRSERIAHERHTTQQNNTTIPAIIATSSDRSNVVVLRIDNVPWDVTPASLIEFFSPYAVVCAHVLLDPKGKTLSHAYVEVPAGDARNALRNVQNKSLGKGKRLRGVTVTMSGQAELMRALFPNWLGGFDGAHPTLDGLDRQTMVRTLENGLITLPEINGLLTLMKNPKSHFLKVPTLPFYSLVSILSKFPAEGDSRVFWSAKLRDVLYDFTTAACDLLVERIQTEYHDRRALEAVVSTAVNCHLFTDIQRRGLFDKMIVAVAARGGELSCAPPGPSTSATISPVSEACFVPDDCASIGSASTASARGGNKLRSLGYGMPSTMFRKGNPLAYAGSVPFNNSLQSSFAGLASPPMLNSPLALGYQNANMNIGVPFSMSGSTHAPYDVLAREFNVEPDLVAALAQRLAYAGQTMSPQAAAGFTYANGMM